MAGEAVMARFWAKVNKAGSVPEHAPEVGRCWEWTGAQDAHGYGRLTVGGQWRAAHRWSFELAKGAIPAGKFVLHRCDNPACIRPTHLRLGTPRENTADMHAKGRAARVGPVGEQNRHAKLTALQVVSIRERFARGELIVRLATDHALSVSSISSIVNGRSWAHVGGPIRQPGQLGRRARKAA
jgi:hypothetical protein